MAKSTQVLTKPARQRTSKKKYSTLSTCPVNAMGWCSYPFTVAQLEKKLKQSAKKSASKDRANS
jgi:hypothetical protein